jgi:hypothetical protein
VYEYVERACTDQVVVSEESQTFGRANRTGMRAEGHDLSLVRMLLRPRAEHLPRPDRVEFLDVVEEQNPDALHACHSVSYLDDGGRFR